MNRIYKPNMFSRATDSQDTPISAIFFDLDNTLITTRKADRLTCNKLAEYLYEEHAVPREEAAKICSNYLKAFRKCPDNTEMTLEDWRRSLWSQSLENYSYLNREIYIKWKQLRYHYLALTPEIKSLLQNLRQHYFLALITNGPSCAQWEKVQQLNLNKYFDIILVSGDLPWEKPSRQIFDKACHYLGVAPKHCIMVGDKLETDIQGGIEAELGFTVWIPLKESNLNETDPCPDYTITSVTELPKLLKFNKMKSNIQKVPVVVLNQAQKLYESLPDINDCNSNSSDGS